MPVNKDVCTACWNSAPGVWHFTDALNVFYREKEGFYCCPEGAYGNTKVDGWFDIALGPHKECPRYFEHLVLECDNNLEDDLKDEH